MHWNRREKKIQYRSIVGEIRKTKKMQNRFRESNLWWKIKKNETEARAPLVVGGPRWKLVAGPQPSPDLCVRERVLWGRESKTDLERERERERERTAMVHGCRENTEGERRGRERDKFSKFSFNANEVLWIRI